MPFISNKDIDERIKSPDNLVNRLEVHRIDRSRLGSCTIPLEIKKVAAILVNEGERGSDIVRGLDLNKDTVSRAARGIAIIPSGHKIVPELKRVIDKVKSENELNRETAEGLAITALLSSLNILPNKIPNAKAKDVSSIAKDMATVANLMSNRSTNGDTNSPAMHLHLYAPKQKEVKDYEVIDV